MRPFAIASMRPFRYRVVGLCCLLRCKAIEGSTRCESSRYRCDASLLSLSPQHELYRCCLQCEHIVTAQRYALIGLYGYINVVIIASLLTGPCGPGNVVIIASVNGPVGATHACITARTGGIPVYAADRCASDGILVRLWFWTVFGPFFSHLGAGSTYFPLWSRWSTLPIARPHHFAARPGRPRSGTSFGYVSKCQGHVFGVEQSFSCSVLDGGASSSKEGDNSYQWARHDPCHRCSERVPRESQEPDVSSHSCVSPRCQECGNYRVRLEVREGKHQGNPQRLSGSEAQV